MPVGTPRSGGLERRLGGWREVPWWGRPACGAPLGGGGGEGLPGGTERVPDGLRPVPCPVGLGDEEAGGDGGRDGFPGEGQPRS